MSSFIKSARTPVLAELTAALSTLEPLLAETEAAVSETPQRMSEYQSPAQGSRNPRKRRSPDEIEKSNQDRARALAIAVVRECELAALLCDAADAAYVAIEKARAQMEDSRDSIMPNFAELDVLELNLPLACDLYRRAMRALGRMKVYILGDQTRALVRRECDAAVAWFDGVPALPARGQPTAMEPDPTHTALYMARVVTKLTEGSEEDFVGINGGIVELDRLVEPLRAKGWDASRPRFPSERFGDNELVVRLPRQPQPPRQRKPLFPARSS